VQPWLADQKENYVRRLTRQFADFEYDVPADATQLIVEIRVATTWWNEIAAFDNVRITAADSSQKPALSVKLDAGNVSLTFTGTLQSAPSILGPWTDVVATSPYVVQKASVTGTQFFRAK
jgi:hypothetical protein